MKGFKFDEGVKAKVIAQVWDRAGNTVTGSVSDSMVIVDQLLPELITLEITSILNTISKVEVCKFLITL